MVEPDMKILKRREREGERHFIHPSCLPCLRSKHGIMAIRRVDEKVFKPVAIDKRQSVAPDSRGDANKERAHGLADVGWSATHEKGKKRT